MRAATQNAMPKRKRSSNDDGSSAVRDHLETSKKLLHRALKVAKGFARQKLGNRSKAAKEKNELDKLKRIDQEILALKGLDLNAAIDRHLGKKLGGIKGFEEAWLGTVKPQEVLDEDVLNARKNVESGMWNDKKVKEAMANVVRGTYISMGIPMPVPGGKSKDKREPKQGILKGVDRPPVLDLDDEEDVKVDGEPAWEGFDSPADDEEDSDVDMDDETISRYDDLIAGSSDEESFDEETIAKLRAVKPRLSLSISPEPEGDDSEASDSDSDNSELAPPSKVAKTKSSKKTKDAAAPTKDTFLPNLMGGYFSGSESASEIEDDAGPPIRKNRRGQAARRAIWEKKYGASATHIVSGAEPVGKKKSRDDGWDARKGAVDGSGNRRDRRAGGERGRKAGATGTNSEPVAAKRRVETKKDDVGVLHPSWQAAKKAKEEKATAKFQGKKVTFD